jgi:hypothetical protein
MKRARFSEEQIIGVLKERYSAQMTQTLYAEVRRVLAEFGLQRVVALEYDGTILSRTRKYLRSHGAANAALCRAGAKHLPFSDESFDLVLCLYAPSLSGLSRSPTRDRSRAQINRDVRADRSGPEPQQAARRASRNRCSDARGIGSYVTRGRFRDRAVSRITWKTESGCAKASPPGRA